MYILALHKWRPFLLLTRIYVWFDDTVPTEFWTHMFLRGFFIIFFF